MELVSKVVNPLNNFWVEQYNKKAKEFFVSLGFKEVKRGLNTYLEFSGGGTLGFWTKREQEKIFDSLSNIDGNEEFDWDGEIYQMNRYN